MKTQEKKPINVEIGQNIRKYRELSGYSRESFAERLGLSPRFVANIEVGAVGVSPSTIKRVCEVLSVSADRILWTNDTPLSLEERVLHIPAEYHPYVNQFLKTMAEMVEEFKTKCEE